MAQTKVTKPGITDDAVTTAKILDDAVTTAKILDDNVTTAKILDDNVTTAKILDLNVTNAKIAAGTIDVTSKITGKVPAANLGTGTASATTYLAGNQSYQALSEYDDDAIKNDIATLVLHQATNANAAKYNLVNTNVDQYEDSTGITSFTNCARDTAGEYVSSVSSTAQSSVIAFPNNGYLYVNEAAIKTNMTTATSGAWTFECWLRTTDTTETSQGIFGGGVNLYGVNSNFVEAASPSATFKTSGGNGGWYFDHTAAWSGMTAAPEQDKWVHFAFTKSAASGTSARYKNWIGGYEILDNNAYITVTNNNLYIGTSYSTNQYFKGYITGVRISDIQRYSTTFTPVTTPFASDGDTLFLLNSNTTNGSTTFTDTSSNGYTISYGGTQPTHSTAVASPLSSVTENATGNYVSTATTANASVSSMGAVITYKNNAGTNTLNTDIILEVSANGGTNYTTAVLTAGGTFSTGILQAVVNDISVTAGTSIQYRLSFANQSSGSKEARIYGASLIY